jgi:tight adherence protein C
MTALLAALAVLLGFGAAWQVLGERGEEIGSAIRRAAGRLSAGRVGTVAEAALALGIPGRLERAGMARRWSATAILAAKLAGTLVGVATALVAAPALPGRLAMIAAPLLAVAGFLGPDAILERSARLRHERVVAGLPDALDLLAVGAASGRSPAAVIAEIARAGRGPLAAELAITAADTESGRSLRAALEAMRERAPGPEVGALVAAMERSRRYGSPLADQLHAHAMGLRRDARRRLEEHASRAAPKIQLVVALVLVPSVLLMILAAILAHSDALFGAVG